MSSLTLLAAQFRKAVRDDVVALFQDQEVTVAWGSVGRKYTDDMIVIGKVRTEQEHATSNRGREVTLTLEVEYHSYRPGDGDTADQDAFERMVEMAGIVSEHLRSAADLGNATLGDVVRDCFETEFDSDTGEIQSQSGTGRLWVGLSVYEAHARLRG